MRHAETPDRIGPYRVMDRLGEGGMGTVYAGTDESGRKVAIKVIRREYAADPQYRARFEAEVRAAQRVRPFCTAPVLDADPRADPPYLVTEFVNGQSLDAAVAEGGPLRGADLEAVAVGIATALTAVHDAGVVHRDLKPANVLLSTFGPRVIDFGIARSPDGTRLTATGGIVGTPAFMAPEQLDGRGASPASDVWAWGATVAFAARADTCFGGKSLPAVIHQIMSAEPDLSGLDGSLLRAVRRALAKDPAHRPSAQELLDGLISSGVREHPGGPRDRTPAPPRPDTNPPFQASTNPSAAWPEPHAPSRPERYAPPPPSTRPSAPAAGPALADGEAAALVERQYRQAAQAGDPAAMRNLATLLRGQGRTAEADSWTRYADAVSSRPAPPYGPPAPHAPPGHPHAKPPLNSYAIYALTFGLVGLVTCGLPSIPAIVAGHLAWGRVRRSGERGLGLALTGIALGWIMVAFWLLLVIGMLAPPAEGE
ncbi:protein kinase domain-containing protein [Actinomadura algeriensis]|uniref:Serine/threonine protein kinase n=1 Tax=Actinomadura algeriensis TaxID=1679523 RepID=A0ABR9JWI4_9ACTN|nr:protein kinase [Actinomadura algeriensis]MBE1534736.1 serine/threonine protein kinase [Actinomadura algeriensis]